MSTVPRSDPEPRPAERYPFSRLEPYGREHLPFGFGMTALVLGAIGMMLCFLPVLGVPLSALGLLLGLIGLVIAWRQGGVQLRWSVLGVAASFLALVINIAITFSPWGYVPQNREVPKMWRQPPDRPYVPPPEPANTGPKF